MDAQYSEIIEACRDYTLVSGIGLSLIDDKAELFFQTGRIWQICGIDGEDSHLHGCRQSKRFGGRYVFFCQNGLTHFCTPVFMDGAEPRYIISEPLLMVEKDDYLYSLPDDVRERCELLAADVPYVPPVRVHALSELLFSCTERMIRSGQSEIFESLRLQGVISDYIMRIKMTDDNGFYPLDKEDDLLDAMTRGDVKAAKALLNELLGHIFFYSGFRFDVIRSRVLELIVLLSRAAMKGGADPDLIFGLNYEYLQEVGRFKTVDDMAFWLNNVMNRFTDYVFNFTGVKHTDIISKAARFINSNYMKKITLEDVAEHVFLSPTYFSKLFKDEVGFNFITYLNKTRISQSKKLLLNEQISLNDIASMVGFDEQAYFSKVFKKLAGISPLKFRQSRGVYTERSKDNAGNKS